MIQVLKMDIVIRPAINGFVIHCENPDGRSYYQPPHVAENVPNLLEVIKQLTTKSAEPKENESGSPSSP